MAKRRNQGHQAAFLAAYGECGNLTLAARIAGVGLRTHYDWMAADSGYRARWEEVREEAVDLLAAEARRRAVDGIDEPVIYQGALCYERLPNGKRSTKPLAIKRYSDVLLMFLMKAARPDIYRDHWKGELRHSGVIERRGPDLSSLTDEELEQIHGIYEAAAARLRRAQESQNLALQQPAPLQITGAY